MHDMLDTKEQNIEAWDALTSLKKGAKVKLIGVSNIEDLALLKQLHERNPIDVVQNPWFIENGWDQAISAFCVANNIMYQLSPNVHDIWGTQVLNSKQ
jgi:diketogulonate reductase-like aldo/keto reductase